MLSSSSLTDSYGRIMRDLRVSVTDRCNFRCLYCLPETEEAADFYRTRYDSLRNPNPLKKIERVWKPRNELLSFEEIERVVRIAVSLGVEKIRVTGGEPLLRQRVEELVGRLARIEGVKDLAMTTNGFLFGTKAEALKLAGLRRVSFSMDSLDPENFKKMTGRDGLGEVLAGIETAMRLGFESVKVNAVVIRGINDHEIEQLAAFGFERGIAMRYIEFMPLDSSRSWLREMVVSGAEILGRLKARYDLVSVESANRSETARRWRLRGGGGGEGGELGIIAPVTEPFCGHCNRIRMTADGKIRTCLFSLGEHDLRGILRGAGTDQELATLLRGIVWEKEDRHHIGEPEFVQPERTMSCIGG